MIRFLLLVFVSSAVMAQQETVLNGQIETETEELAFITIVNRTLKKGTISDVDGKFNIPARVNDVLDISSIQFEGQEIIVTARMIKEGTLSVFLKAETTVLPEIQISNFSLSGNLENDASEVKTTTVLEYNVSGKKLTPSERRLYTATTRGADAVGMDYLRLDIPLAAVFNAISGKTKKLKKQIELERTLAQVVELENKFAQHFFTEGLEIPVSRIEDFLFYAQVHNDTILNYKKINDLELIELLVKEAEDYKEYIKE